MTANNNTTKDPRAAATAILAETLRQTARRLRDAPDEQKDLRDLEAHNVRTEAKQVATIVHQAKLGRQATENLSRPYRSAIASVVGGIFWQPGIQPELVIQELDTVPMPDVDDSGV